MGEIKLEKGSEVLVKDIEELLAEANAGEFGDFTNEKYDSPKMVLAEKFIALKQNVVNGKYD